jgi:hypothetical protein
MSMMRSPNFEEVFGQMVAGSLPLAGADPMASVALVIRDLLGTDAVHAVVAADTRARRVHYFAVPSRVLHSTADLSLPLTAAIPGHPSHEGDGAYVMHSAPVSAAAIVRGGELKLIVNEATLVEAVVSESGLPAFDVSDLQTGWRMISRRAEVQRVADRASTLVARGAGALAAVAAAGYVGFSAAASWLAAGSNAEVSPLQQEAVMREALRRVDLTSPLTVQLGRIQSISAVAVRAGGWIDLYQLDKGVEHYRIVLPEWVTRDYLSSLDPDVRADRNGDGTIQVIKGTPGRDSKPGSSPVPPAQPLVPASALSTAAPAARPEPPASSVAAKAGGST